MPTDISQRWARRIGLGAALLLSACAANQYRAPDGAPATWGEQHYLANQLYQQTIADQQSD